MRSEIRKPREEFSLSMLVYFMTIYSLYMQFDGFDNYIIKVLIYVMMAGLIVISCIRTHLESINNKTILGFILFIIIVSITSCFVTPNFNRMWFRMFDMIVYTVFLVAIYIACSVDKKRIFTMLWLIVISAVLCSIALCARGVDNRTGGLVLGDLNQNEFSNIALLGTFCALYLINCKNQYKSIVKLLLLGAVILIAYAGLLGGSRKFFVIDLAMIMAFFMFCVLSKDTFKKRSTFGWCIVGSFIFIFAVNYAIEYAMTQTIFGQRMIATGYYGDTERIYFYKRAWGYFLEHPVFGLGINGFAYYEGKYTHSLYMEILSCTGIVGILLFFSTISSLFSRYIMRIRVLGEESRKSVRLTLIYLLAIFINGFFTPVIYATYFYIAIGLIVAMISGNINKRMEIRS